MEPSLRLSLPIADSPSGTSCQGPACSDRKRKDRLTGKQGKDRKLVGPKTTHLQGKEEPAQINMYATCA